MNKNDVILIDTVDGALDLILKGTGTRRKKKTKAHFNGLFLKVSPPGQFHFRIHAFKK